MSERLIDSYLEGVEIRRTVRMDGVRGGIRKETDGVFSSIYLYSLWVLQNRRGSALCGDSGA